MPYKIYFSLLFFFCAAGASLKAQVTANAGNDRTLCPGVTSTLGGSPSATGGTAPYTYSWFPPNGLSSPTIPNPIAAPQVSTWYILTITDANGNSDADTVAVLLDPISLYNAGPDTGVCVGTSVQLGDPDNSFNGGVTYTWTPGSTLDNPNAPRPNASPTNTTVYTVTISSPNCPTKVFSVDVTVHPMPVADAGSDVTIYEGENTTLNANGGAQYFWGPTNTLTYASTANPDAEPTTSTTYTVGVVSEFGCTTYDTVRVTVIPDDDIVIYNTFTPNGDGNNDTWFIGNIQKYPEARIEIFNRYGQQVFSKTGYLNDWNGTNFGDKLPEATYYYVIDLGNGTKHHGSVTIIR